MSIEYAIGNRRSAEVYRGLCEAAGVPLAEFADWIELGGLEAACCRAGSRLEERRTLKPRQAQVELLRKRLSP